MYIHMTDFERYAYLSGKTVTVSSPTTSKFEKHYSINCQIGFNEEISKIIS